MPREDLPSTVGRTSLARDAGAASLPAGGTAARAEVGAVMAALSAYMANARERPLPDAVIEKTKHHVLDTLAAMISGSELAARPRGDRLRARLWRRASRDRRRLGRAVRPDRGGARQRRAGPRRRDRRLARALAVASGLRRRAGGAGGRRAARHRRHAFPARRRARLRRRAARHHGARRSGPVAPDAQEQPQHRRRVRRRGGRRLCGRPRRCNRCAGSSTTRRSSRPASPLGSATPITSRRRSCSAACRRAAA